MKILAFLAIVGAAITMPAIAWAADDPSAGCPASFTPLSIADTLVAVDERIYPTEEQWAEVIRAVEGQDANGDGVLCIKQFKPNKGQDKHWGAPDYVITQVFDNIAKGRL